MQIKPVILYSLTKHLPWSKRLLPEVCRYIGPQQGVLSGMCPAPVSRGRREMNWYFTRQPELEMLRYNMNESWMCPFVLKKRLDQSRFVYTQSN